MVQDTRKPTGKMDFDTEDRLLPANHYRYAKNGRSGTSDRDGEGAVENIRGNVLRGTSTFNRGTVIGSCPDVKNNAVIFFRKKAGDIAVTYTSATRISGTQIEVVSPSVGLSLGEEIRVEQTSNTFNAVIVSRLADVYTISLKSGTFPAQDIVSINIVTNNVIVRYFEDTQTFQFLTNPGLMGDVLNFTGMIYNPRVIESSFGQLLTWVQYPDGEPCLMNIDRMKVGAEYYNVASDDQYIALAKQPPYQPPSLDYENEIGSINYLQGRYFQFRYRYVYDDNQASVYSPISKVTNSDDPYSKVQVTVNSGHKTVRFIEVCVKISEPESTNEPTVWYRFLQVDKSQEGWLDNSFYQVDFFGSEQLITIPTVDTDKNFESIPINSNTLEVVNQSQIVLGDNTEGYDNVDIDCDIELAYQPTGIMSFGTNLGVYATCPFSEGDTLYVRISPLSPVDAEDSYSKIKSTDVSGFPDSFGNRLVQILADMGSTYTYNSGTNTLSYVAGDTLRQITTIPSAPKTSAETITTASESVGSVEETLFTTDSTNEYEHYSEAYLSFTASMLTSNQNVTFRFYVNAVLQSSAIVAITTTPTLYTFERLVKMNTGDTFSITVQASSLLNALVIQQGAVYGLRSEFNLFAQKGFKYDSTASVGIVYYDEYLRSTTVQAVTDIKIPAVSNAGDVQMYSTETPLSGYVPSLEWEIRSLPPLWAKYYQFVYKGTTVSEFAYMLLKASVVQPDGLVEIEYEGDYNYIPEIGDVCRYITRQSTGNYETLYSNIMQGTTYSEVVSVDIANKKFTVQAQGGNYTFTPTQPNQIVFEIRRKQPEINPVFHEFSEFYEIGDAGTASRYHKGQTQDQDPLFPASVPATGVITNGDIYFRYYRELAADWDYFKGNYVYKESLYPSEGVNTHYWDKGRVNIQSPFSKQVRLRAGLRWGGKLINETLVNNLSTWDEGNINTEINPRFGAITGLRQIGYTLKIVQWANINSAFIGRRELQNADGSTNLVVTDNLIGTINPSEKEFGTKYPGSIISTGQRLYYFDSLKSKYIVDDGNGVNEIALYGGPDGGANSTMSKYFRQLANTINASSNYDIITGFDYLYRDMYVTITNRTLNTQETLYYNETQNAWKYFVDMEHLNLAGNVKYIPDFYGNVGQSFFAFMLGNTFQFNKAESSDEPLYSQLFKFNNDDPLKKLVVETVGMIEPDKVKVFLTHALHANLSPELVEITVPPNQMYPNGMYTRLKPGNYKYREGVFYADIKRDAYTKGFTTDETVIKNLIANGRPMRGHVCVVRLTFSTSDYCKLFTTSIGMIPSELS